MRIHITGFLPDDHEDDLLKFDLLMDPSYNGQILEYLGHKDLIAMSEGLWDLAPEQVSYISELIGEPLPSDLEMLIGVVSTN